MWAQVKTTHELRDAGEVLHYDLDAATYNVLCRKSRTPRVLIVVTVPSQDVLAKVSPRRTVLLRSAYWADLTGKAQTQNTSSRVVPMPKTHLLTRTEMIRMIATAGVSSSTPVPDTNRWGTP